MEILASGEHLDWTVICLLHKVSAFDLRHYDIVKIHNLTRVNLVTQ